MDSPLDPDIVQHAMKVERAADQVDPQNGYTPATEVRSLKPWTMFALAAGVAVVPWLGTWHWSSPATSDVLEFF